ncbi:hypothetical protein TIFTF001_031064 [Ficus carica]|uniref:Uncharacterized protein n=1 Tax=Ficus carica TaxID=3494 RepID=A0AA88J4Z8_FICCA|nr:hypothetical protein TIFTF001_031064 [Ficus carica]
MSKTSLCSPSVVNKLSFCCRTLRTNLDVLITPLDIVGPDGCQRLRGTIAENSVSVVALALLQAQSPLDLKAYSPNNPLGLSVGKGFGKTSFDDYTAGRCRPSRIHPRSSTIAVRCLRRESILGLRKPLTPLQIAFFYDL